MNYFGKCSFEVRFFLFPFRLMLPFLSQIHSPVKHGRGEVEFSLRDLEEMLGMNIVDFPKCTLGKVSCLFLSNMHYRVSFKISRVSLRSPPVKVRVVQ